MTESIADQEWVWDDATRAVIRALETPGAPVRFVGGCVRDGWLKKKVTDIDLATPLTPDQVCEKLAAAGMKPLTIGIEHGTISVFLDSVLPASGKQCFEITTLRRDIATDGRHATVEFTDRWDFDACRRDFTINALYANPDGEIYNPFEEPPDANPDGEICDPFEGLPDLKSRRVRFIGDPGRRIEEDFLRILRFFRFSAVYGGGDPDQDGLVACVEKKDGLSRLSGERVRDELRRVFMLTGDKSAVRAVHEMNGAGILSAVLSQTANTDYREKINIFAEIVKIPSHKRDWLLCLGALIHDANAVADRLRLSRASRDRLCNMEGKGGEIFRDLSERDARQISYRIGQQAFCDRVRIARSKDRLHATYQEDRDVNKFKWEKILAYANRRPPRFLITGDMVCTGGILEGPEVGRILKAVEDWWVENNFPKKADTVARLKVVVGERGRK